MYVGETAQVTLTNTSGVDLNLCFQTVDASGKVASYSTDYYAAAYAGGNRKLAKNSSFALEINGLAVTPGVQALLITEDKKTYSEHREGDHHACSRHGEN